MELALQFDSPNERHRLLQSLVHVLCYTDVSRKMTLLPEDSIHDWKRSVLAKSDALGLMQ